MELLISMPFIRLYCGFSGGEAITRTTGVTSKIGVKTKITTLLKSTEGSFASSLSSALGGRAVNIRSKNKQGLKNLLRNLKKKKKKEDSGLSNFLSSV